LDEAEPLMREACDASRATLGDRHPDTITSIGSMGRLPLLREALDGNRATLGDRHPSTLTSINNMGELLRAMGRLEEAEPLLREGVVAA
jgi:hypothetical protein